jgi:hypothetical protein
MLRHAHRLSEVCPMIALLKSLWRDRRGNVLAIVAASLPLIVGGAGLATDTIQWTLWKRQLQRAADSAAVAGVYDREAANGSSSTATAAVSHDLGLNLHSFHALKAGYPQVAFPANSGVTTNQVSVTVAIQQPLSFSSFFMSTAPLITATATAASIPAGGSACVQALETSASATGITNTGNTTIDAPDCVLYSNSPSANSASAGGSSSVTAQAVAAVGGIQQSNHWTVQAYRPYSPSLPDPFANVTPSPSEMNCTTAGVDANTTLAQWTAYKAAGTNCFSSLGVGSNKSTAGKIPADFGPIFINGGSVDLKGEFNCTGCTIILTNTSTASNATIGSISSNAQATNNITAPTTGKYKGIAIYQDRRATGGSKINGGSSSVVTGAVYFPGQELTFNGNGSVNSTCTMLVARRIVFTGSSAIKLKGLSNCALEGLPSNNSTRMIRLVG